MTMKVRTLNEASRVKSLRMCSRNIPILSIYGSARMRHEALFGRFESGAGIYLVSSTRRKDFAHQLFYYKSERRLRLPSP